MSSEKLKDFLIIWGLSTFFKIFKVTHIPEKFTRYLHKNVACKDMRRGGPGFRAASVAATATGNLVQAHLLL